MTHPCLTQTSSPQAFLAGSLRFAERAKKIENKAVVNRDPKAAKLAAMMEENAALRLKVHFCL